MVYHIDAASEYLIPETIGTCVRVSTPGKGIFPAIFVPSNLVDQLLNLIEWLVSSFDDRVFFAL